jgi:hypothetical protein
MVFFQVKHGPSREASSEIVGVGQEHESLDAPCECLEVRDTTAKAVPASIIWYFGFSARTYLNPKESQPMADGEAVLTIRVVRLFRTR